MENLNEAVRRIKQLGNVIAVSSFQVTDPVGFRDQPQFINGALLLETKLSPPNLMQELLKIEQLMGRERSGVPAKGPRMIDLDLIFVEGLVFQTEALTLPHPRLQERSFVLAPLAELAPNWVHPVFELTVAEMQSRLNP